MYVLAQLIHHCLFSLSHTQLSGMGLNFKYPPLAKGFMMDGCHTVFPFLSLIYIFFLCAMISCILITRTICLAMMQIYTSLNLVP